MQRSRSSEMPQRQSQRGPFQPRTSGSHSDPTHHRRANNRSPKAGDRPSPKGVQSNSVNQKKLGTRLADLESQLGQAQDELKNLKNQLATAEAAKREAQEELEKKTKNPTTIKEKHPPTEVQAPGNESQLETDVFEVPVQRDLAQQRAEHINELSDQTENEAKQAPVLEAKKAPSEPLGFEKKDEISFLKVTLGEKEKELELCRQEKENLKQQLTEAASEITSVRNMEQDMALRLSLMREELGTSRANATWLSEKLEAMENEKEALEGEMMKLSVQTEQWRKAADAAAAVIATEAEVNGTLSSRCGSMNKSIGGEFDGGYPMYVGSPGVADENAFGGGFGSARRKSGGMRMFVELWKRRGHKS